MENFYEMVLVHFNKTIFLFRQAEALLKDGKFFSMRVEFHYCPIIGTLHGAGTGGSLAFFGTSVYTWNQKEHLFYQNLVSGRESNGGFSLKDQSFQTGILPFGVGKDGARVA
uniref:hypothetical protein n=1 Tax=Candidatus Fimivicinus sp. TaxID=3056640 RepID=UPI003FEE6A35